jgi:hypothetical protein
MRLRPADRKCASYWSQVYELLVASVRGVGRKCATGPNAKDATLDGFDQRFPRGADKLIATKRPSAPKIESQ